MRGTHVSRPAINVALDKPVSEITGYSWPEDGGVLLDFTAVEDSCEVTLMFPSGTNWMTESQLTYLAQEESVVSEVVVTPLSKSTSFANALAHVTNTARELGIEKTSQFDDRVDEWLKKPPSWNPFAAVSVACEVEPKIKMFAEVKPSTEDGKWFVSYSFTVQRFFRAESE